MTNTILMMNRNSNEHKPNGPEIEKVSQTKEKETKQQQQIKKKNRTTTPRHITFQMQLSCFRQGSSVSMIRPLHCLMICEKKSGFTLEFRSFAELYRKCIYISLKWKPFRCRSRSRIRFSVLHTDQTVSSLTFCMAVFVCVCRCLCVCAVKRFCDRKRKSKPHKLCKNPLKVWYYRFFSLVAYIQTVEGTRGETSRNRDVNGT